MAAESSDSLNEDVAEKIAAGSFASIWDSALDERIVIKLCHHPAGISQLRAEKELLLSIYKTCRSPIAVFHIPRPGILQIQDDPDYIRLPQSVTDRFTAYYSMEAVARVPRKSLAPMVRELFFPESQKHQRGHPRLIRLYLGRQKDRVDSRFFYQTKFPLSARQIAQLGLSVVEIAKGMGQILARMHWLDYNDAKGCGVRPRRPRCPSACLFHYRLQPGPTVYQVQVCRWKP